MDRAQLEQEINAAWDARDTINASTTGATRDAVQAALGMLDDGSARVAEPLGDHQWQVNQWLKKAVLLSFRLNDMAVIPSGSHYPDSGEAAWWDKVPSKFAGWDAARFGEAGFRAVPGCIVRHSAHIAAGAVLMPSFVNLGAYVDRGTMVDTWATVGSCAQIGKNVHLSGGAGIGGSASSVSLVARSRIFRLAELPPAISVVRKSLALRSFSTRSSRRHTCGHVGGADGPRTREARSGHRTIDLRSSHHLVF